MDRVRIREIYRSIQGESTFAGWPCTFVRTAGCDIRCTWCDEPEALEADRGELLAVAEIIDRVREQQTRLVEVTGGEPLLQRGVPRLVSALLDAGFEVLLETGGHHDISVLDPRCRVILDMKAPSSGVAARMDTKNLERMRSADELKLVIMDRGDYEWARDFVRAHGLEGRAPTHFSPVHGVLAPQALAEWILVDGLQVRLNLQLHKYIWGADTRGV